MSWRLHWAYLVVESPKLLENSADLLNEQGDQGWELVHVSPNGEYNTYIFKRPSR